MVRRWGSTILLVALVVMLAAPGCPKRQLGVGGAPSPSDLTQWSRYLIAGTSGFLDQAQTHHQTECTALSGTPEEPLATALRVQTATLLNDPNANRAELEARIASTKRSLKTKRLCNAINTAGAILNLAIDSRNIYCAGTPPVGEPAWGQPGGLCRPDVSWEPKLREALLELTQIKSNVEELQKP